MSPRPTDAATLERVRVALELAVAKIEELRDELEVMEGERDEHLRTLRAAGVPNLHKLARLTPGRVSQIAGPAPRRRAAAPVSSIVPVRELGNLELTPAGVSKANRASYTMRPTTWLPAPPTVLPLVDVLRTIDGATPEVERVFLVGPRWADATPDGVRAWLLGAVPDGWGSGPHYLGDVDAPVGRFTRPDGRPLELHRAAGWLGEGTYSAGVAAMAMGIVHGELIREFGDGATWLSTPASTGRALWRRTIPAGRGFPVQSADVRELLHATSGQARRELLEPPPGRRALEGFAYLDGRLMYGALTWGMPVGEPARHGRIDAAAAENERLVRGRSRWRVRFSAPKRWSHVGLFMAPASANPRDGWHYPRAGETWADGSEVWLGLRHGWRVEVLEGLSWAEGKPLDEWAKKLRAIYARLELVDDEPARLARGAIRRILLFGIGAFASSDARDVYRSAPVATANPPADARDARVVGDVLTWAEPGGDAGAGPDTLAGRHPEWAAAIWARARVRLLEGPDGTGALALPRESVVAFSTDALYLTHDPEWPDDGKPGRFRRKGSTLAMAPGFEVAWPTSWPALYALRDATGGDDA